MGEGYQPRPDGRFVTFAQQPGGPPAAPYTWPQDTLDVPEGYGLMPRIDPLNAKLVGSEFFGMYAGFAYPGGLAINTLSTIVLPTPKDGDFWFTGMAALAMFYNQVGGTPNVPVPTIMPYCFLQITDIATGYKLFPTYSDPTAGIINGVSLLAFDLIAGEEVPGYAVNGGVAPNGAGVRTDFIQPYCFVRSGGIQVDLQFPSFANAGSLYFGPNYNWLIGVSLAGFKEYANAST